MDAQLVGSSKTILFEKRYIASRIACVVFIVLSVLYLFESERTIMVSGIAYFTLFLFFLQFIFQFKVINGIMGGIMALTGLYFSLAVWSEFKEFELVNESAKQLLLFGFGACIMVLVLAGFMIRAFIRDF